MEDEIDIYADLPAFSSEQDSDNKNDRTCNCTEIKKNFDLLMSKFEGIQKSKEILEHNFSSLLKTAKLEIARKDKMIEDLRKRLDDITFKRNSRSESLAAQSAQRSHQRQKCEDVTLTYSNEVEPQRAESYHDVCEYKSTKQNDDHSNQKLTLFGKRLHKRMMENEKEEKQQLASSKCHIEPSVTDMSEENVVESDKENGSQFDVNSKSNEFTATAQNTNSETVHKKNSEKRRHSDDSTRETKRFKTDSGREKVSETDNCITCYDLKDGLTEYEMEDNVDFDYRLDAGRSVRAKRASHGTRRGISPEHEDAKDDRDSANCAQKKREESNLAKDYNGRRYAENLRSFRATSASSHVSERSRSGYRKNGYIPSRKGRSHSRSRSDYETSGGHRFQERSKKSYRDSKYDDYKTRKHDDHRDSKYDDYRDKYDDARHKSDRLGRICDKLQGYDIRESRSRRRCDSGERDLRNKLKSSTSDVEDRASSYRDRCESRRARSAKLAEVSDRKRRDKSGEAAARPGARTSGETVGKDTERHGTKNESDTEATGPVDNTATRVAENSNLEEGEIVDSPEKNSDSANRTSEDTATGTNGVRTVPVEDKAQDIPVDASVRETAISPEENAINQVEQVEQVADVRRDEAESRSSFAESEDRAAAAGSPAKSNAVPPHVCESNDGAREPHPDENSNSDPTARRVEVVASEQARDRNADDDDVCKTSADEKSENSVVAKSADEDKKTDDSDKKSGEVNLTEEVNNPVENSDGRETSNPDDGNCARKTGDEEATSRAAEIAPASQATADRDNKDEGENRVEGDAPKEKSDTEMSRLCLRDHNYVQAPATFDRDAPSVPRTPVGADRVEADPGAAAGEAEAADSAGAQPSGVKRASPPATKGKRDQRGKGVIISRRRRAVILSDNDASMTVLRNTRVERTAPRGNGDSVSKPRACKASRPK